jgi:hypothetical protein
MSYVERHRKVWTLVGCKSVAELRTRVQQELAKRCDLLLYFSGFSFGARKVDRQSFPAGQFFFSTEDLHTICRLLREKMPQEAVGIVDDAERICKHRFDLLGYKDLEYGPQIDWHLDTIHGKRSLLKPWYRVRYLDFSEVGDHKIVWELNRHQHLVTLTKAYQLTRDERFAAEAVGQWYDWQRSNPYPMGINWVSSLEVAFRSLSWLWVRHLLAGAFETWPSFLTDLLRGLEINGRHIERYLSTYFSPNTHLLGEGVALFFIGILCPEIAAAERWKRRGWEIVLQEAQRQVQPDGMHFEQSVYYHVYALDFFLHSKILAERNEVPIPAAFNQMIESMLAALNLLAQAGPAPRLGDDDGGRVFNPRRNRAEHMADPLSTGAVLFNRPDFKATAGYLREETIWLLGLKGVTQFEGLPTSEPLLASGRLESSGNCVMASSVRRPEKLVIDAGPLGHGNAGHGHADALSLEFAANGTQWLVDPGTGSYISEGQDREKFRGTGAHNTLQVDGLDQAEPSGPFAWRRLPRVCVGHWVVGQTFDFFSGRHDGYCRLQKPVIHQRLVFYLKGQFWLVHDRAEGDGRHHLALNWHMGPEITRSAVIPDGVVLGGEDGQALAFVNVRGQAWRNEINSAYVSPAYGHTESSLVLCFSTEASLPAEFTTLVVPLNVADLEESQLGTLAPLRPEAADELVYGYLYERTGERHSVFFAGNPHSWSVGSWSSDADMLYFGMSEDGCLHLAICNGSFVKWSGEFILKCDFRVERWELLVGHSESKEFCSDQAVRRELNVKALPGPEGLRGEVVSRKGAG